MTFSKKAKTENKKQLHHSWKWQKGIKNGWKQISLYCHLITESEGTRLLQTIIRKYVCCSGSHRLSLNHDPNGKKPCEAVWHMEAIYSKSALWFGRSGCSGTSTASSEKTGWLMEATCMQWQIVSPRYQDMTSGLARQGGEVVVTLFPGRVADLVVIGVHDAAGTLLSILSTFILSTGLFLILRLGRSMSQTRGSHSSLRQSHLKSETGQRREKNIKIRFIGFFLP